MDDETRQKIHETHRDVAVLKEQYQQIQDKVDDHHQELGSLDERVGKLEAFRTKLKAVLGAGSTAIVAGWTVLRDFGHKILG